MTQQTLIAVAAIMAFTTGLYMSKIPAAHTSRLLHQSPEDAAWNHWKMTHGRTYGTSAHEQYRKNVFMYHYTQVTKHNADATQTYKKTMNKFADLEPLEWKKIYASGFKKFHASNLKNYVTFPEENLPAKVDYTDSALGTVMVTPVKDQGQCGSCWTFSSTGALEGNAMKTHNTLVSLSEQQLIDCYFDVDEESDHMGCGGGVMTAAFQWWESNAANSEDDYPYEAEDPSSGTTCRSTGKTSYFKVKNMGDVEQGNKNQLKASLYANGPTSVAVAASTQAFQLYSEGVLTSGCGGSDELDHAVLAVGYGTTDDGHEYFLVKNSWGPYWGDNGYIKIGADNVCGILEMATAITDTEVE